MKIKLPILFFLLLHGYLLTAVSPNKPENKNISDVRPASVQYGFIENKGQVFDQFNKPNKAVLYLFNGLDIHVQLKQNSFSYETYRSTATQKRKAPNKQIPANPDLLTNFNFLVHRIDITFLGSSKNPDILHEQPAPDFINYFSSITGQSGVTQIHHYQKITYQNIYPNIDVEFLLNLPDANEENDYKQGQFKYNFIIHPGGNINDIKLKFEGADKSMLTAEGHIILETSNGKIDESIPYSFQTLVNNEKQSVNAYYIRKEENIFGIAVEGYDKQKTLVIDPAPWSTYFGGNGEDRGTKVAVDKNGNILGTGTTSTSTGLATAGAYQTSVSGNFDAFIIKYNHSGMRLWSTYLGGSGQDNGNDIAVDQNNNIFITGNTLSSSGIATAGSHQSTFGNGSSTGDAFLMKFNASGVKQWGTYIGGSGDDYGDGIAIEPNGNLYISGFTNSASLATSGAFQTSNNGNYDAFLVKFNSAGIRQWCTYYGSIYEDYGYKVTTDANGNASMIGYTVSNYGITTSGAFQTTFGGNGDAFLVKFNAAGDRLWCTYIGGNNLDYASDVSTDISGNILVAGTSASTNGIASSGAFMTVKSSGYDAFIAKYNPAGSRLWSSYIGGGYDEGALGICSDIQGNIAITGYTYSSLGFTSSGAYMEDFGGDVDAFIVKFDSLGYRQWSTYYGADNLEQGNGLCVDSSGNIFVTGITSSTSGISSPGAFQTNYGGGVYDVFMGAFTPGGSLLLIQNNTIGSSQQICQGSYPASLNGSVPLGGNTAKFYIWLSSVNGPNSGFVPASLPNSFINYSPNSLISNTWYKRVVISGDLKDTSQPVLISIIPKPVAGFTINNPLQCLNGNHFIFTDTSYANTGTYTRLWNLGAGLTDTSSLPSPERNYYSAGSFYIKLIATGSSGCKDSLIKTINTRPNPVAGFSINSTLQCVNNNVFFLYDTSTYPFGTASRVWDYGDGNFSTEANPVKSYIQEGTYKIRLIALSVNGCQDSASKTVRLFPKPTAGFSANNLAQCLSGNNFIFQDTSINMSGTLSRIWSFSTLETYTSANINKSFSLAGIYEVKLSLISDNNCRDSVSKTLHVFPQPFANFSINNNEQCLAGNSFTFTDLSSAASGLLWRYWNAGDLTSNTNAVFTKSYTQAGVYYVKLIIADLNQCKDSLIQSLRVKSNPAKPVITAISSTLLQSTPAHTYLWFYNNNPLVNSNQQQLIISQNGNYKVTIDSTNGCSSTSDIFNATKVSAAEIWGGKGISIYPNPSGNEVFLISLLNQNLNDVSIEIFDMQGNIQLTQTQNILVNEPVKMDISSLSNGVYILLLNNKATRLVKHN
ncbi:MAG: PKD domain-containing protein [Bacteroidota bacterium]|nr:PKD domain-containing protein [Bacteroidota bacterium]